MEKKEYTEQQKADAVKRAGEIGVQAAAKELGIPWQALAQWNKSAGNPTTRGMKAEKKAAKEKAKAAGTKKTTAKKTTKAASKKTSKISDKKATAKTSAKTAATKSTAII